MHTARDSLRLKIYNILAHAYGYQPTTAAVLRHSNEARVVRVRSVCDQILSEVESTLGSPMDSAFFRMLKTRRQNDLFCTDNTQAAEEEQEVDVLQPPTTPWKGEKRQADLPATLSSDEVWYIVQTPDGTFVQPRKFTLKMGIKVPYLYPDESFKHQLGSDLGRIIYTPARRKAA